jgi:SAM-dependent methyltransferase
MSEQDDAARARSQRVWAAGNFARIGAFTTTPAERLVEEVGLRAGQRVLDIACGNGAVTLAAARRQTKVVGVDFVPELLEHGRKRTELEGLNAEFVEGHAEDLRFPDASFDVVLSQYGVMFAANQERAASEMLRVCRPGGVIGLANWTPMGFPGVLFRLGAEFNPPPVPPKHPVSAWGTGPRIGELLGPGCNDIRIVDAVFRHCFVDFQAYIDLFSTYFGPVHLMKKALAPERWEEYVGRLREAIAPYNRATDGTLDVANEFIIVVAQRKG